MQKPCISAGFEGVVEVVRKVSMTEYYSRDPPQPVVDNTYEVLFCGQCKCAVTYCKRAKPRMVTKYPNNKPGSAITVAERPKAERDRHVHAGAKY